MSRRDGKQILPCDLTPAVYEGSSIIENLVLASSNLLRAYLGLKDAELIPGPIPRFVTRINPSLDNYFADLLLRSCYVPVDYLPAYEEHVIRGSQDELPSTLNPRLVGSVLIGIGYRNHSNPDFKKVYDEHERNGERWVPSASQVVFMEHLKKLEERAEVQSMKETVLDEINDIDSQGRSGGDHLSHVVGKLNKARFRQPGFVAEPLEPQWKRAILGAVLSSTCVTAPTLQRASRIGGGEPVEAAFKENRLAITELEKEWVAYIHKSDKMRSEGYLDDVDQTAKDYVKKQILGLLFSVSNGSTDDVVRELDSERIPNSLVKALREHKCDLRRDARVSVLQHQREWEIEHYLLRRTADAASISVFAQKMPTVGSHLSYFTVRRICW